MPPLPQTTRLRLRAFRPQDLDALARLYADPAVRAGFPEGVLTRDQTAEELDWWLSGGDPAQPGLSLWAVEERASGRLIGRGGLLPLTLEGRTEVEVAWLLDRAWWGRGLGTEMARALVRHGFGALGLTTLVALVAPENRASAGVARKAGMRFERFWDLGGRCEVWRIDRGPATG